MMWRAQERKRNAGLRKSRERYDAVPPVVPALSISRILDGRKKGVESLGHGFGDGKQWHVRRAAVAGPLYWLALVIVAPEQARGSSQCR